MRIKNIRYRCLGPRRREDGIVTVGQRMEKWTSMTYNGEELILLPYEHRFSKLYADHIHCQGHMGVSATTSKARITYCIVNLEKMVKSIRHHCVSC